MSINSNSAAHDKPIASVKISSVKGPAMFGLLKELAASGAASNSLSNHILVISRTFVEAVTQGAPWTIQDSVSGRRLHGSAQNFLQAIDRMVSKGLTVSAQPEILTAFKGLQREPVSLAAGRGYQPG